MEVQDNEKVKTSLLINIVKGFLQEDSYSPVGSCLTEVPTTILEETYGYRMGKPLERNVKRTHNFFIDELKVCIRKTISDWN